ncbi:hypothetical protein JCM12178A_18740 [Salidesulfovibrio brasiliensis]
MSADAPSKYQPKNFKRSQSIQERITTLKKIGIDVDCADSIITLAKVKNCLTHRQGFVGDDDLKKSGGQFKCIWYYVDAEAVGKKKGQECVVNMETPVHATV